MFLRSMADMKNADLTGTRPALLLAARCGIGHAGEGKASSGSLYGLTLICPGSFQNFCQIFLRV